MNVLLRIIAWLLAAAVTFATLGPPRFRPHSSLGQDGEHALAFVLIGLAFGLAYPRHRMTVPITLVLIGVLELLQFLAPGRHPRLEDFIVDLLAACVGFVIAALLGRVTQSRRRRSRGENAFNPRQ